MANWVDTSSLPQIRVIPRNRNIEISLLFFALGINAFEIAQIQLAVLEVLTADFFYYWLPPAIFAIGLHLLLRFKAREADAMLLPIATLLNGLGIAMIYRLDLAAQLAGESSSYGQRQVIWTMVAMSAAGLLIWLVPSHLFLKRYIYISMAAGIVLLLAPLAPFIGRTINGARLWIGIGDLTFQPGELAKLALTVFFAGYLVNRRDAMAAVGRKVFGVRLPRARELGPILLVWLASLGVLIFQRDLGTSLLYFALFLVMIYVATGRAIYVGVGMSMFVVGALTASRLMSYVQGRFDSWLDPFNPENYNAIGGSYQLVQGLFGFANGGILGTGLGGGMPYLVPLAESDYIFASIGEELGLVGVFAVLALYLLLVSRGLRVAFSHRDDFSKLLAVGLSTAVAIQCFVVIGGVTRIVPLTGLTTPFLAAGGSSLLANWILIALLLRISDSAGNQVQVIRA